MLYYDRVDLSEGIDLTKIDNGKEYMVCRYSYFFRVFKFQNSVMVAMIWQCYVLILATLLIALLKGSIIAAFFMTLTT